MKGQHSKDVFIAICKHLTFRWGVNIAQGEFSQGVFQVSKYSPATALYQYKTRACHKDFEFEMTDEEFFHLIELECFYCGTENGNGIDRVDNAIGYIRDNVVPCCKTCNYIKGNYSKNFFLAHVMKIASHFSGQ